MTARVAINDFGRVGQHVLRATLEYGRKDVTVAAINDVGDVDTNVHLLKYDSGSFRGMIRFCRMCGAAVALAKLL